MCGFVKEIFSCTIKISNAEGHQHGGGDQDAEHLESGGDLAEQQAA
jgi:hypothetical protein